MTKYFNAGAFRRAESRPSGLKPFRGIETAHGEDFQPPGRQDKPSPRTRAEVEEMRELKR